MNKQLKLNFAELEKLMWNNVLETFQRAMVEVLSLLDKYLMATRDKDRYIYKELKERTCITMVGSVTIKRRYYWDKDKKEWVFLLDRALDLGSAQVSAALKELVVIWATKGPSYRDTRDRLKDLFGSRILSHETIRQALITSSDVLKKTVGPETQKKKIDALFIEADGFWTGVQGRGRKNRKKRETKLVVVHEGWEKRQAGGYRLKNPMYITSDTLEKGEDIWDRVRLRIADKYRDIDRIPIIINGDFASWIRAGVGYFKEAMYQYDRFHLKREIRNVLRPYQGFPGRALTCITKNDPESLLKVLGKAFTLSKDEEILKLKIRLEGHKQSTIDYRERLRSKGFKVPDTWRGMGAAESNVDRFKLRTAKRGRAWSQKGLEAILNMLGMLYEGILKDMLAGLDSFLFTTLQTEDIIEMSASQVAKTVGVETLNVVKAASQVLIGVLRVIRNCYAKYLLCN